MSGEGAPEVSTSDEEDALRLSLTEVAPGIYLTDRGTAVVRGRAVLPAEWGDEPLQVPEGELIVEISPAALEAASRAIEASE